MLRQDVRGFQNIWDGIKQFLGKKGYRDDEEETEETGTTATGDTGGTSDSPSERPPPTPAEFESYHMEEALKPIIRSIMKEMLEK